MYIVLLGYEAEKRRAQKEEKLKMKEARRLAMYPNGYGPHGDVADASPNTTSNSKTRRKKRREKTTDVKIYGMQRQSSLFWFINLLITSRSG